MNISKPVKILIGILTLLVVLYPFVIMPAFMMLFMFIPGFPFIDPQNFLNPSDMFQAMMPFMMVFYPLIMCLSVVQLGLQVFYIIHEIKNRALTDTFRILFAIGTFFMPYVAMPIYYFVSIWKDAPAVPPSTSAEIIS